MEGLAAQTHRFLENVTQQVFRQQILLYWFIGVELKVNLGNHSCVVQCIFYHRFVSVQVLLWSWTGCSLHPEDS